MSNRELTTGGGNYLATNDDYFAALAAEASGLKGGGDGKAFMKFNGNDGEASYGADDEPLHKDQELAMNPRSYARGWVIWVDGEVVHEEMVKLEDGRQPSKADLPDKGPYGEEDGPVEQYTLDFTLLEEPYTEMVFQANNVSKRRALAALLKDFSNGFRNNPGKVPVVTLGSREFEGKTKGGRKVTKYAPEFKIVRWVAEAKLLELRQGAEDDYQERKATAALEDRSRDRDDDRGSRRASRDDREERGSRDRDDRDDRGGRGSRDSDREERGTRAARDDEREERRPAREQEEERPARRSARDEAPREDERPARRSSRDDDDRSERSSRDDDRGSDRGDDRDDRRSSRDEAPAEESGRGRGRF